jgi:hypothetical protein
MMASMTRDQALRLLGLDERSTWAEIRQAYRAEIRRAHPDAGGSFERAASLNDAMAVLARSLPSSPESPAPTTTDAGSGAGVPVRVERDDELIFVAPPREVFERLHIALEMLADVLVADVASGVLVGDLHREHGSGRLVIELRADRMDATTSSVEFTLDQIGAREAPPIDRVVRELARLVRAM